MIVLPWIVTLLFKDFGSLTILILISYIFLVKPLDLLQHTLIHLIGNFVDLLFSCSYSHDKSPNTTSLQISPNCILSCQWIHITVRKSYFRTIKFNNQLYFMKTNQSIKEVDVTCTCKMAGKNCYESFHTLSMLFIAIFITLPWNLLYIKIDSMVGSLLKEAFLEWW